MLIGFNLPISGPMSTAHDMARVAQLGEQLGFDYLTLTDHIALPDVASPGYPYSESGEFYSPDPGVRHEQLTAAAWVAAKTDKIRLVLAVMVVPHRPAIVAAKMLTTIDVLSGGRLDVGIGAGWQKVEIDAVATTPFAERGAVTDEYIEAFKAVWTQKHVTFKGKYTNIDGLLVDPKPVQKPHPPIWVGGETAPSMRRAARVATSGTRSAATRATCWTRCLAWKLASPGCAISPPKLAATPPKWASPTASNATGSRPRSRPMATGNCSPDPSRW